MRVPDIRSGGGIFLLLIFLLSFSSCMKDLDFGKFNPPEWNPNIAVPAVSAKLTIADILAQTGEIEYLKQDSAGFLSVFYESQLLSESAGDVITFNNQVKDTTVNVIFPVNLPQGDSVTLSYGFKQKFSNSYGDVVDSIRFREGSFTVTIESMMEHDAKLILISPFITRNGVPFKRTFNLDYTGTLPVVATFQVNLLDYTFVFDHVGNQNNLNFFFDLRLFGDNNPDPGPSPVKLSISQENLKYRALFGLIQTRSMALLSDTIALDMFANSLGGNFWINDPRIGIHFSSSFGIPVSIALDPLKGHSDIKPPYDVSLSGTGLPVPFLLNAPNYSQIGQHVETHLNLNKTNSNIADFLNLLPQRIEYGVEGILNPTGLVPQNFVLDTSNFRVNIDIEIPLEGYASGFTLQDTVEFEFEEDLSMVEWMLFRVAAESTFPIEAALQVTFLDSNFVELDSLFTGPTVVIPGAIPGPPPTYKSTTPNYKTIDISIPASTIQLLGGDVKHLKLTGTLNTAGGGTQVIRVYTDNYLKFALGVQAQLKVDFQNL